MDVVRMYREKLQEAQAQVVAGNEVCGGKVQQYQLIVH